MNEPIGFALRDIEEGESITIIICSDGSMYSDSIEFINSKTKLND